MKYAQTRTMTEKGKPATGACPRAKDEFDVAKAGKEGPSRIVGHLRIECICRIDSICRGYCSVVE